MATMTTKPDPNADVIMYHPIIKKTATVTQRQFDELYAEKGWTLEVPKKAAEAEREHLREETGNEPTV